MFASSLEFRVFVPSGNPAYRSLPGHIASKRRYFGQFGGTEAKIASFSYDLMREVCMPKPGDLPDPTKPPLPDPDPDDLPIKDPPVPGVPKPDEPIKDPPRPDQLPV